MQHLFINPPPTSSIEGYIKVLDKLEEDGDIVSYEDLCDKTGFRFEVKLKQSNQNWDENKIISKFKLSKALSENLTVIGFDGKLREYDDARTLVQDFCNYRMGILQKRIDARKAEIEELSGWLQVKMEFIQAVLDDKITFKGKKKDQVGKQILEHTNATNADVDRLLRINIMSLTAEMVKELDAEIKEAKKTYRFWSKEKPVTQFLTDLDSI